MMKNARWNHRTPHAVLRLLLLCGLVGACSSAGPRFEQPKPPRFVTHIDANGVKHFTLFLDGVGRPGGRRPPAGGPPGGGPPGDRGGRPPEGMGPRGSSPPAADPAMKEKMTAGLRRVLDLQLAQSGFCRDGHQELDSSVESTGSRISGRCNDAATELDREAFPNAYP